MDKGAVFVATCLASALATLLMGLLANYPIALAPGMGLNAYFAYSVVKGLHYSWQLALGAVFLSGLLFLILSLTRVRAWIVDAIPLSQKMAISAGIGLFLGIIALKDAGIVVGNPETLVTLGDLKNPAALLAAAGFFVMVALDRIGVHGAILIAVLVTAAAGILLGGQSVRRHRRRAAEPRPDLPRAGSARRARPRPRDDRLRLPLHRPVRQYRDAGRRCLPRRADPPRRHLAARRPRLYRGIAGGDGRRRCSAPRPSPAISRARRG